MKKPSETKQKHDGKSLVLTIPIELHTELRIEQIREQTKTPRLTMHDVVLKYLYLGYEAAHNGYSSKPNVVK